MSGVHAKLHRVRAVGLCFAGWWCFAFFLLFPGACTKVSAAEHPSFSGTWAMNAAKSDFGPLPAPARIVDRITQEGGRMVIERDRDGQPLTITVPLDGSEAANTLLGTEMKTKGRWDGGTLVIEFSGQRRGNPVSFVERWEMAPQGNAYRVSRHLSGARGETEQTLNMDRQ